jgi:hemerythrin-like domain-containing protein
MIKGHRSFSRRDWLSNCRTGLILWAGLPAVASPGRKALQQEEHEEEGVSPAEDLMREHGVLKRVLLIYRDLMRRIDDKQEFPPEVLTDSARLIRDFIENYHEKLEENYLFPRFRKANRLVELVNTLELQHQRGRVLTARILQVASPAALKDASRRRELHENLHLFVRMYEPHEAREDTVLFPAFHEIVSPHEYDALGDDFEKKENEIFGAGGFEKNVEAVAALEKRLGIYELSQFTPKA